MANSYLNIPVPNPTQNPVPSADIRDHVFGGAKIDEFVTSLLNTYVDRFGKEHYTVEGLRWLAQQAVAQFGWITLDSFQEGKTLSLPNEVLRWKLPDGNGEYYRWDGALPKTVPAGSTPESSGGIGTGKWVSIGDASLRKDLKGNQGASLVGTSSGDTVEKALSDINTGLNKALTAFYKNQLMPAAAEFGGQLSALRDDLSNPLTQFTGIVLAGDSITWGLSATGIATDSPRAHQLTDARNNSSSNTWANLFHKYIGKRFHFNPIYTEAMEASTKAWLRHVNLTAGTSNLVMYRREATACGKICVSGAHRYGHKRCRDERWGMDGAKN
ncbi:tail fiber/spike domain-containing protein [Cronobacter dublinensis]|uniref:tail fiber/spike domain-containing protein n=1 Tax=Cronobacter dublinensis TaxID=413497 RepID=UPI00131A2C14|nr:hypothetical protein [Cronobacter dublinensis]